VIGLPRDYHAAIGEIMIEYSGTLDPQGVRGQQKSQPKPPFDIGADMQAKHEILFFW
jgi:hypothetical protein